VGQFLPKYVIIKIKEDRRLRARSAEQDNLGNFFMRQLQIIKGGMTMVKKLFSSLGIRTDTALVLLGWISFFGGMFLKTKSPILAICLIGISRVLP